MKPKRRPKLVPGELYTLNVISDGVLLYLGTRKSEEITRYRLANHHDDMVEHWWLQTGNTSQTEVFCFEKDLVYLAISHIKT